MSRTLLANGLKTAGLCLRAAGSIGAFLADEWRRGTLLTNLKGLSARDIAEDMSWAELLEERAGMVPDKAFLLYRTERITYAQMDANANRMANFLLSLGGGRGLGVGIFMKNSPRFLDIFYGAQKIGMYVVPLNPELKGDNLVYVIEHSDVSFLALDAELQGGFRPSPQRSGSRASSSMTSRRRIRGCRCLPMPYRFQGRMPPGYRPSSPPLATAGTTCA
jgi:hypothetical protein